MPHPLASGIPIALAIAIGGCGGDGDGGGAGGSDGGRGVIAPINLADCSDWNEGSVDQRLTTIDAIREFTGGPVAGSGGEGRVLDDDRAYDLFENYCENEFARGFKLYKLYGRAAAFDGR